MPMDWRQPVIFRGVKEGLRAMFMEVAMAGPRGREAGDLSTVSPCHRDLWAAWTEAALLLDACCRGCGLLLVSASSDVMRLCSEAGFDLPTACSAH